MCIVYEPEYEKSIKDKGPLNNYLTILYNKFLSNEDIRKRFQNKVANVAGFDVRNGLSAIRTFKINGLDDVIPEILFYKDTEKCNFVILSKGRVICGLFYFPIRDVPFCFAVTGIELNDSRIYSSWTVHFDYLDEVEKGRTTEMTNEEYKKRTIDTFVKLNIGSESSNISTLIGEILSEGIIKKEGEQDKQPVFSRRAKKII